MSVECIFHKMNECWLLRFLIRAAAALRQTLHRRLSLAQRQQGSFGADRAMRPTSYRRRLPREPYRRNTSKGKCKPKERGSRSGRKAEAQEEEGEEA